jgi:hypothetical protein
MSFFYTFISHLYNLRNLNYNKILAWSVFYTEYTTTSKAGLNFNMFENSINEENCEIVEKAFSNMVARITN